MLIFDALPCLESTLADLSEERFYLSYLRRAVDEDVIIENRRPFKLQLASLRLFDLKQDCPSYAGILLLADNPTYYLPGVCLRTGPRPAYRRTPQPTGPQLGATDPPPPLAAPDRANSEIARLISALPQTGQEKSCRAFIEGKNFSNTSPHV